MNDEPGDLVEQLVGGCLASRRLQEELEVLHVQLAPVDVVVLLTVLLDGDVGQMDEHVIELVDRVIVLDRAEATESVLVQVHLEKRMSYRIVRHLTLCP